MRGSKSARRWRGYEMLARLATKHALDDGKPDGSKWARIAIRAAEPKSTLLQDIGMLDRQIGTLFVDDGKPVERTPTGPDVHDADQPPISLITHPRLLARSRVSRSAIRSTPPSLTFMAGRPLNAVAGD